MQARLALAMGALAVELVPTRRDLPRSIPDLAVALQHKRDWVEHQQRADRRKAAQALKRLERLRKRLPGAPGFRSSRVLPVGASAPLLALYAALDPIDAARPAVRATMRISSLIPDADAVAALVAAVDEQLGT